MSIPGKIILFNYAAAVAERLAMDKALFFDIQTSMINSMCVMDVQFEENLVKHVINLD